MAERGQIPGEYAFKKGDTVKLHGLKSKKEWNRKRATVLGEYDSKSKRYPICLCSKPETKALIKPSNMKMEKYGLLWKIDGSSNLQQLNMLLKSYTRDLEAFAKLTARNKDIFCNDFEYTIHENIHCKSMSEFDSQLNAMKNNIIKISEQTKENVPKLLQDKTTVLAMNDELTQFEITVEIDLHDNNKFWRRVSNVKLNKKEGLIRSAKVTSIQIVDKSQSDGTESTDKKQPQKGTDQSDQKQ